MHNAIKATRALEIKRTDQHPIMPTTQIGFPCVALNRSNYKIHTKKPSRCGLTEGDKGEEYYIESAGLIISGPCLGAIIYDYLRTLNNWGWLSGVQSHPKNRKTTAKWEGCCRTVEINYHLEPCYVSKMAGQNIVFSLTVPL